MNRKSIDAIDKALVLDENLAAAHSALYENKYLYEWDFAGAERECKRAGELDANSSPAHLIYARFHMSRGRHDEIKTAIDLEPASLFNQRNYGDALYYARRFEEAAAQYERVIAMDQNFGTVYPWLRRAIQQYFDGRIRRRFAIRRIDFAVDAEVFARLSIQRELYTLNGNGRRARTKPVAGGFQNLILTDTYNRRLDKGRSVADQRHTFVMSLVTRPQFNFENKLLRYIFNNNQLGMIAAANSGETFNLISLTDINNDGVTGLDRPVGTKRNSGTTPPQFNLDLRCARFLDFTERYRFEIFGEFTNLFNVNSIIQFNNVQVTTDDAGRLSGGFPDFRSRNQSTSQESRQFQLGFKFLF